MSNNQAEQTPGIASAIAEIEKRNGRTQAGAMILLHQEAKRLGLESWPNGEQPRTVGDVIGHIARRFDAAAQRGQS